MSEETHNADISAPRGIVSSIGVSLIAGWILLLAITFVVPTDPKVYATIAAQLPHPCHLDGCLGGWARSSCC